MDLLEFYKKLFQVAGPLEVPKAKERGKLLEHAWSLCRDIDDRVRDVLRKIDFFKRGLHR